MAFGPFSKCTEACGPVIHFFRFRERFWHLVRFRNAQRHVTRLYIFLVFMSVFGILPIFEMHRGMWPGYTFSRFHERFCHLLVSNCFWHVAHFRNAQKHAIRSYIFLVFTSVFGILPIFEMHRRHVVWSYIFLVFMRDLKKVIEVNFRSADQLI